jgi:hypothetical protein
VSLAVAGVLSLVGLVVTYVVLLWLGKRFFAGRYRAETAAGGAVIAFILGLNWPRPAPPTDTVPQSAVTAPSFSAAPAAASGVDVGATCSSAHLTSGAGKGHVDAFSVQTGNSIAAIVPKQTLKGGDLLIVGGWAAKSDLSGPSEGVCVVVDGKIVEGIKVLYGTNRSDVAAVYKQNTLTLTGFEILMPAARLVPGPHRIEAAAVFAGGSAALLPGAVQVVGPPFAGS